MKPVFVLTRYGDNIRAECATFDEIRAVAEGKSDYRLVHVELGDAGIVTTPVRAEDLAEIAGKLDAEREAHLRDVLDSAAQLVAKTKRVDASIHIGSLGVIQIYINDAPWAEPIVERWANERKIEPIRNSPPRKGTSWYPDAEYNIDDVTIVRLVWPSRTANTDEALEHEVGKIRAERTAAERELAEIDF